MSTNCIVCVKNKRTGGDLLCDECRAIRNQKPMRERLQSMQKGQWLMCNLMTRTESLMTGIVSCGIRQDGIVKVQYSDGSENEKPASERMLDAPADNFTALAVASHFTP